MASWSRPRMIRHLVFALCLAMFPFAYATPISVTCEAEPDDDSGDLRFPEMTYSVDFDSLKFEGKAEGEKIRFLNLDLWYKVRMDRQTRLVQISYFGKDGSTQGSGAIDTSKGDWFRATREHKVLRASCTSR